MVAVHLSTPLRRFCNGASDLQLAATTVRDALIELEERYPELSRSVCDETGRVRRHINLFVNKSHVRELNGELTPLSSNDVLTILPAVSGG